MKWIFLFLPVLAFESQSNIFTCEVNGQKTFSDRPCPKDSVTTKNSLQQPADPAVTNKKAISILKRNVISFLGKDFLLASTELYTPIKDGFIHIADNAYEIYVQKNDQNKVGYISITFLNTGPCKFGEPFNYLTYFSDFSIDREQLRASPTAQNGFSFYDYQNKLKIYAVCPYDNGNYQVALSSKYFLQ